MIEYIEISKVSTKKNLEILNHYIGVIGYKIHSHTTQLQGMTFSAWQKKSFIPSSPKEH